MEDIDLNTTLWPIMIEDKTEYKDTKLSDTWQIDITYFNITIVSIELKISIPCKVYSFNREFYPILKQHIIENTDDKFALQTISVLKLLNQDKYK